MTMRLGPYIVSDFIARGGMGAVWRGVHHASKREVAIKILLTRERDYDYEAAFVMEAQMLAQCHHPHVISVLDFGQLDSSHMSQVGGLGRDAELLSVGTPYIVMERAYESLKQRDDLKTWSRALTPLREVLSGLAHIHAHGIIHRDLKPSNVLVMGDQRYVISDFGIATQLDYRGATSESDHLIGTPLFMAPEQIRGAWRDIGPWTDLYALGSVMCWLLTGRAPFAPTSGSGVASEILTDQLFKPLPHLYLDGVFVPEVQRVFERLLAKEPRSRFSHAMEVLHALEWLDSMIEDDTEIQFQDALDHPTETIAASTNIEWLASTVTGQPTPAMPGFQASNTSLTGASSLPKQGFAGHVNADMSHSLSHVPALADDLPQAELHLSPETPRLTSPRGRIGPGLIPLIRPSLIGRTREMNLLWQACRDAQRHQHTRVIHLRGDVGVGKSRLASWVCEEAAQTGAVEIFKAFHPTPNAQNLSLNQMVLRKLRCQGLSKSGVIHRVRELSPKKASETHQISDFLIPFLYPEQGFALSTDQVHAHLCIKTCEMIAESRLPLFWLDDVDWALEGLKFVKAWQDYGLPGVFVLTSHTVPKETRDHHTAERSRELLESITQHAHAQTLTLDPLAPEEHQSLVQSLLTDIPDHQQRWVADHTHGNPLFLMELVTEWSLRGALADNDLDPSELSPPQDMQALWRERLLTAIERSADQLQFEPAVIENLLDVLACLGLELSIRDWETLCDLLEIPDAQSLLSLLVRAHLLDRDDDHYRLSHFELSELIVTRARARGTLSRAHHLSADFLGLVLKNNHGLIDAKIALHRYAAERSHSTLQELLLAFRICVYYVNPICQPLKEAITHCLETLPAEETQAVHAEFLCLQAQLMNHSAGARETSPEVLVERALTLAHESGDALALARIQCIQGNQFRLRGDLDTAHDIMIKAVEVLEREGDLVEASRACSGLVIINTRRNQLDEAWRHNQRSIRLAEQCPGEEVLFATSKLWSANVLELQERFDEAREIVYQVMEILKANNVVFAIGSAWNTLGEIERKLGHIEAAREAYLKYINIARTHGIVEWIIPQLNLCLMELMARDPSEHIDQRLQELMEIGEQRNRSVIIQAVRYMWSCLAALRAQWDRVDELGAVIFEALTTYRHVVKDNIQLIELTITLLEERQQAQRAQRWRGHLEEIRELRQQAKR